MRMKCLRIFPETMPRISRSELSRRSLNIALGNAVVTVASTSIGSLLATQNLSAKTHRHRCNGEHIKPRKGLRQGAGDQTNKQSAQRGIEVAPHTSAGSDSMIR